MRKSMYMMLAAAMALMPLAAEQFPLLLSGCFRK